MNEPKINIEQFEAELHALWGKEVDAAWLHFVSLMDADIPPLLEKTHKLAFEAGYTRGYEAGFETSQKRKSK